MVIAEICDVPGSTEWSGSQCPPQGPSNIHLHACVHCVALGTVAHLMIRKTPYTCVHDFFLLIPTHVHVTPVHLLGLP
jgi:hypothetical protein